MCALMNKKLFHLKMMMMKRKKVDGLMSSTYTLPLLLTSTTCIPDTTASM